MPFYANKHKLGFVSGYGSQAFWEVNYDYQVIFFEGEYFYSFLRKRKWGLEVIAQPQYNMTKIGGEGGPVSQVKGFEFGLNMGLLVRRNFFSDRLSFFTSISTGPHYVSDTPERQASGYIFSDNFNVGMNVLIYNNLYLEIKSGVRHISNLGFQQPNYGVNNTLVKGGFFIAF